MGSLAVEMERDSTAVLHEIKSSSVGKVVVA